MCDVNDGGLDGNGGCALDVNVGVANVDVIGAVGIFDVNVGGVDVDVGGVAEEPRLPRKRQARTSGGRMMVRR